MAISAEDQQLVADMRNREFNIKKRNRAANAISYESRRYRRVLAILTAVILACVLTAAFIGITSIHHDWLVRTWRLKVVLAAFGAIIGSLLAQALVHTRLGRRLLASEELRLNKKYSGELHAGRRWMPFYYQGEDISGYVPQILYVLESEQRFDSVQAALEFVKQHQHENTQEHAHALRQFNAVAAQTNLMVLSSVNAQGRLVSQVRRFVTTDRPGRWYAAIAPGSPQADEFAEGKVALTTVPTEGGATISSNRVRIRRAGKTLMDIADLYRAQVPGYLDGMTEEDQRVEPVYELTLQSAEVDSWNGHHVLSFWESDAAIPQQRPGAPARHAKSPR
jgi:uncharacterized integral membrane protein